jgi:hypothetical protein
LEQHVEVVDAAIVAESLDTLAGELGAEATMGHPVSIGTSPDLAPGAAGMDVEKAGAAARAGEPLQAASLARSLFQQVFPVREGSAVVIAGTAIEATGT